jgi:two-component system sensor histidine kinase QseC
LDATSVPRELLPVVQRVNGLLARLEAAFARERAFSDDVAHELRTPLAALRTTLEVAVTRPRSHDEHVRTIHASAAIVGELQGMVERLLQIARLDAGRPAAVSAPYDLADFALEAWEPYAGRALARGLRVDLDLPHGFEASWDRELFGSILRNLHDNAVTYADTGGHVRIAIRDRENHSIRVEVSNSGSRLDQGQASVATQRFWRGDAARTEAGVHCGLGLALVEKATRALGGTLNLHSRVGGEFVAEVTLPILASRPEIRPKLNPS